MPRFSLDPRSGALLAKALCAAACALACSDTGFEAVGSDGAGELGAYGQALAGAEVDTEHDAVLLTIDTTDYAGYCSGTLIAPNLVLTAQHCVAFTSAKSIDCQTARFERPNPATELWVSDADSVDAYDLSLPVAVRNGSTSFVPAARVYVPERESLVCGNDIALIVLEEPMPDDIAPISPRLDEPVERPAAYAAIGFGEVSDGVGLGTRRARTDLEVACAAGECNSVRRLAPNELLGDESACIGDSGGPALDTEGRVFGVASRAGENCGSTVYTAIEPWAPWIREVATLAWQAGDYPEPDWLRAPAVANDDLPALEDDSLRPGPAFISATNEPDVSAPLDDAEHGAVAHDADTLASCALGVAPTSSSTRNGAALALLSCAVAAATRRSRATSRG